MYIQFSSTKLDASQVTDYIERVIKPQFFTVEGVAEVQIFGASDYALRIWLDPAKMAAQNLSAMAVRNALSSNNVQTAAGMTMVFMSPIKIKWRQPPNQWKSWGI